jgi:hypothetical protein
MDTKYLLEFVPALGVLVAAIALYYQILRSRFSMNLDLVLKLDDRFNSAEFKRLRATIAESILEHGKEQIIDDIEDVFDFFETVGYFVKHNALNKKIVWHTFYVWIHGYWSEGKEDIHLMRQEKKDDTLYEDFQWLHNKLLKIERARTGKREPELLSKKEITEFFEEEKRYIK